MRYRILPMKNTIRFLPAFFSPTLGQYCYAAPWWTWRSVYFFPRKATSANKRLVVATLRAETKKWPRKLRRDRGRHWRLMELECVNGFGY